MIIDVSEHNGVIDWNRVKPHIEAAIIRCGYGDNISSQDDIKFKRNADECTRLGIPFGVYIYSYAKSTDQAKSEAAHVLRLVKNYKLSLPIYYDLEQAGTESGAVNRARIFAGIIKNAGYRVGMYANENWWNNYLKGLDEYPKWVAKYSSNKPNVANTHMWQYCSDGHVDGISGNVDCNQMWVNVINNNTQQPSQVDTNVQVTYAVRIDGNKILPFVNGYSDYAGIRGHKITDVAIKVNKGSIKYSVHCNGKWLPYVTGCNWNDSSNGYAGNGKAIDAIKIYYTTPKDIVNAVGYKEAVYRVSPIGGNYYSEQHDEQTTNGQDGYAGSFGKSLDRLQIKIS